MTKKKSKLPKTIKSLKPNPDWLDFLWSVAIKARAGFKDEISGDNECDLNAHHIIGKASKILRWIVLENGISISTGRHKFGAHGSQSRQEDFRQSVRKLRDVMIYDQLYEYKSKSYGSCSGCDEWEDRNLSDAEIEEIMINEATIFDNMGQYGAYRANIKKK